jgi:exopolysaccharide biosynthesis WecB/TagA/CpsF family protein
MAAPRNRTSILGLPFDRVTRSEAVEKIASMIDAFSHDGKSRYVVTVNVDFVVNALDWRPGRIRFPELVNVIRSGELVLADGMPLVWLSRLLGTPLPERVTGADLVPDLIAEAAKRKQSVYLLGGSNQAGRKVAEKISRDYPGIRVVGYDEPMIHTKGEKLAESIEKDKKLVDKINRARPDILLIAFGNPKQEIWYNRNREYLKIPVSIGIGGTFEFITGRISRAPEWMQNHGLEWIYRISQEPRRLWKRYAKGFVVFSLLAGPLLLNRLMRRPETKPGNDNVMIQNPTENRSLKINLPRSGHDYCLDALTGLQSMKGDVRIDVSQMKNINPESMAWFTDLITFLNRQSGSVSVTGIPRSMKVFIRLHHCRDLLRTESAEPAVKTLNIRVTEHDAHMLFPETVDSRSLDELNLARLFLVTYYNELLLDFSRTRYIEGRVLGILQNIVRQRDYIRATTRVSAISPEAIMCMDNAGLLSHFPIKVF